MSKGIRWWGMALTVAVSVSFVSTVRADDARQKELLTFFKQGVVHYQSGEYDEARQAFDKVLAMDPGMQGALEMRNQAELGLFVEMKQNEQLGPDAEKLLDLMTRADREQKRVLSSPEAMVTDFQSADLQAYGSASIALRGHGPYAVPYLVDLLGASEVDQQTAVGRTVALLGNMHRDACLPLIQALQGGDDVLLKSRIAGVLGQIGDGRAVAALMAVLEDEATLPPTKQAAAEAVERIAGQPAEELGSAAQQYLALGKAYFAEQKALVGYTHGMKADVWHWDAAGAVMQDRVKYEQVPNYLYYQMMATEAALDGLATAPDDEDLQALLGASLVRQLALCEYFKAADVRFGGKVIGDDVKADAAERAAELALRAPVVLRLLKTSVVARSLQMALEAGDGPAGLYLVKAIGQKLDAAGPNVPGEETVASLAAAVDSGDKDVRYEAAIVLVRACPAGDCGPTDKIVNVMAAALRTATLRNALLVMDDFQLRNKLVTLLREKGVATTEARVREGVIEHVLWLEPSVEIVFLSANVAESQFGKVAHLLGSDARTKGAPLFVVVDPGADSADVQGYAQIEQVLSPDDLRAEKLEPILQEHVFAESRSAFTEEEEAVLLDAAHAVSGVDPLRTAYNLAVLEPALVSSLAGYSENVAMAAMASLAGFASDAAVAPLSGVITGGGSLEIKLAACDALAAVLKRSGAALPDEQVQPLLSVLSEAEQVLRESVAEVLSAADLSAEDMLKLVRAEGLGEE